MSLEGSEILEKKVGKKLYDYQHEALEQIFMRLRENSSDYNLLYQLPTGGGKTVIFSEIAKRFISEMKKSVLVLTHRIELCAQTSNMLEEFGVKNMIINSKVKELPKAQLDMCYVAMVETLNNRLQENESGMKHVGLVIIDEAHYNSFRKLFHYFKDCVLLGVTATPLSSNMKLPMKENYDELIVGDSISKLIEKGFLSQAETFTFDVSLRSLKIGINGDYTVKSSDMLYSNFDMLEKLLNAYEQKSKGKKTLIFNNGIQTSKYVVEAFENEGYEAKHLDNTNSEKERKEILTWFREKPNAILSSVSILTTGFDEPTVDTIILNRATRSLTLYHQMIGRGSRILPTKNSFNVIDLGNNVMRFGLWEADIDWQKIFKAPSVFLESLQNDEEMERYFKYHIPEEVKVQFPNTDILEFDIKKAYDTALAKNEPPKNALNQCIEHHAQVCVDNSEDSFDAIDLADELQDAIEYCVKQYCYCLSKATPNYVKWLREDFKQKLHSKIRQLA